MHICCSLVSLLLDTPLRSDLPELHNDHRIGRVTGRSSETHAAQRGGQEGLAARVPSGCPEGPNSGYETRPTEALPVCTRRRIQERPQQYWGSKT